MAVSPARKLAFDVLLQVQQGSGFAEDLLRSLGTGNLKDTDRRLATEIVMGTLRLRGDLDSELAKVSGKPCSSFDDQVLTALRLGAYQIRWLKKIPKSASVNESVELTKRARKRSAAGLVNAILRKFEPAPCRPGDPDWTAANPEALECATRCIPEWLRLRWGSCFGAPVAAALAWTAIQPPPVGLRLLGDADDVARATMELKEAGIRAHPSRFSPNAVIAEPGQRLSGLRLFRDRRAVIQDEASQLVASLLAVEGEEAVLDLCAAPGLKTSQIAAAIRSGIIVACDRSGRRLRAMKALMRLWGPSRVPLHLLQLDAAKELPFETRFSRILIDAPCSGTGTLARNPEIKWRLAADDLAKYASRQRRMLRNALDFLSPGGRLVYSTCSLEPEENEDVIGNVLGALPEHRPLRRDELLREFPRLDPLIDESGFFHTRPDLHGTDGFFAAVIQRES